MKIDRSNYESYFIDYIDGNLSTDLVDEFLDFLRKNPDLAIELKTVENIRLEPESAVFPNKEQLFRSANDSVENFDIQAAAYLEGDFNEETKKQFLIDIADDAHRLTTLHLLQKMRLKPDMSVQFPAKNKLLRKGRKPIYLWAVRVAALLILFFSVWALAPRKEAKFPVNSLAEQKVARSEKNETPELANHPMFGETIGKKQLAESLPEEKVKRTEQPGRKEPNSVKQEKKQDGTGSKLMTMREEIQIPAKMESLTAHLGSDRIAVSPISMPTPANITAKPTLTVEEFLAYKLIDAPKGESFTFNNLANAGLKAAQNITNDRFAVERNTSGKIEEIKFESRLIAFSIPIKKNR